MAHFVEIVMGAPSNRGRVIPLSGLSREVVKARSMGEPLYRSYYLLDQSALEHTKTHPTLKGFTGSYGLDRILFDIDKGEDTDNRTLDRVRGFLYELMGDDWKLIPEHIQVWHSGRGYHVTTPDFFGFLTSRELPQVVSATLKSHFNGLDAIYDHARIIRVGGTVNPKTRRFKVPLTVSEAFNLKAEEIFALAKAPRTGFHFPEALEDPPVYRDRIVKPASIEKQLVKEQKGSTLVSDIIQSDPTTVATCMQQVWLNGEPKKYRHVLLQRLSSVWRRQGLPLDAALKLAKDWCKTLEVHEVDRTVRNVYQAGYKWGCEDEYMKMHCQSKCIYFKDKRLKLGLAADAESAVGRVSSMEELAKSFEQFVTTDFSETSFDLSTIYKLSGPYRIYPGEFITVMGDTGVGKTAWLQNVIVSLEHMKVLYLSLEVSDWLLFRRFVQIKRGVSKELVTTAIQQGETDRSKLIEGLGHIDVLTLPPTLEEIASLIQQYQPRIVVVDTLDGIEVKGVKEELGKLERIALGLKEMAQQMGLIIFGVHHISKSASAMLRETGLNVHSGKGASTIEQKADKVIGIEGSRDLPHRVVHSMKSRDESNFRIALHFNPATFRFEQTFTGNFDGV